MKNRSKKFWLTVIFFIVCLIALISTSLVPIFFALRSKAKRLYPANMTDLVAVNEIFFYEFPEETKGIPFGLSCSTSSLDLLDDHQAPVFTTLMHYGLINGITPDPLNHILLTPNRKVSIHITGKCSIPLRFLHGDIALFEYPILQETFQVGESLRTKDELHELITKYSNEKLPQDVFDQIFVP